MPVYRRHPFSRSGCPPAFWLIYVLSVIFTFHGLLVAYSSSTYMEQFATPAVIGTLYTIGSALAVLCFLFISSVLRRIGNVKLTLWLSVIELLSLVLIGTAFSPELAIVAFVIFLFVNPLLYLNIDIFSESLIGPKEEATGSKRGLALTLMSLASVVSPLALAFIVGDDNSKLHLPYYVAAAIFFTFILLVLIHFKTFKDPVYKEVKVLEAIRTFWQDLNLRFVFLAHFVMQVFFSWMIIYLPLYMATEVGLSWSAIGSILAVGLFAYVIFEYPVGILADKYIGEKEMMAVGFVLLAVTSSWISFMAGAPILSWMILMFISRVGASLVEVTTESYFFKNTKGSDANIISFFRLTRPLAMIIGSLLGSAALLFLPFELIFIVLGLAMIPGIFFASRIKDSL